MNPAEYDITCDKCGGSHIDWSEYEHMIWCRDCKIDTKGTEGIFGGPIPYQVSKMLGISFDKFDLKRKIILKEKIVGNKIVWRAERKKGGKDGTMPKMQNNECREKSL